MPRLCAIPGCRTHKAYYERGVALFCFPREPRLLAAWNIACSSDENLQRPRYAGVCQRHFPPSDIETTPLGRLRSRREAVPTLFLDGWRPADEPVCDSVEDDEFQHSSDIARDEKRDEATDKLRSTKKERKNPPHFEQIFLEPSMSGAILPEDDTLKANMFCRLCGMKHEKDNKLDLDYLQDAEQAEALFALCLIKDEAFESTKEVCTTCFQEISSFLDFLRKCHEGQRRILEQLTLAQKAQFDERKSLTEPNEHTAYQQTDSNLELRSNDEDEEEAILSEPETDETEEMKDARMDRYIDQLIIKLKKSANQIKEEFIPRGWECLDCREMFELRNHLTLHRRKCPLVGSKDSKRYGPFTCKFCGKVSKTLPGYRYHLLKMHDKSKIIATGTGQGKYKVVDEQDENYPEELRILKSRKTIVCPICQDFFNNNYELRYHLPRHKSCNKNERTQLPDPRSADDGQHPTPLNPFMCNVCGKMERSNASLTLHMKFHLKQKDWHCHQCDKKYYTKSDLKLHVNVKHEKITYTCDECGLVLNSKATLSRHKLLHDESKLKPCQFCPKKFAVSYVLRKHIEKRHQGIERPRVHDIEMPVESESQWKEDDDGETANLIEYCDVDDNDATVECS